LGMRPVSSTEQAVWTRSLIAELCTSVFALGL